MSNYEARRFVDPLALASVPAAHPSNSPRTLVSPGRGPQQRIAQQLYDRVANDPTHQAAKHQADVRQTQQSPRSSGAFNAKAGHRPNFLVCYLCGQQFSKGSLNIHQPQCYVKQLIAWERGTLTGTRGAKPVHPDEWSERQLQRTLDEEAIPRAYNSRGAAAVDAFNAQQMQHFNTVGMTACEHCGRTFLPDRLVVHQRSCKAGNSAKPVRRQPAPRPSVVGPLPASGSPVERQRLSGNSSAVPRRRSDERSDTDELENILSDSATMDSQVAHHHMSILEEAEEVVHSLGHTQSGTTDHHHHSNNEDLHQRYGNRSPPAAPAAPAAHSSVGDTAPSTGHGLTVTPSGLVRCKHCQRTFAPDRIERHEGVCIERSSANGPSLQRAGSGSRGATTSVTSRGNPAGLNASFGKVTEGNLTGRRQRASPPPNGRQEGNPLSRTSSGASGRNGSPGVHDLSSGHNTPPPGPYHPPKFCTECGEKLAYDTQRFCGECGMRVVR